MGSLYEVKDFPLSFKVNQLDAQFLEHTYHEFILSQLSSSPGWQRLVASLGVTTVHLWATLWKNRPTPGNLLYNVQYPELTLSQKCIHFVLQVADLVVTHFKEQTTYKCWSALVLVNFLAFLVFGKYRSLPERAARIQLSLQNPKAKRLVDYSYTARLLVMQVLSDTFKSVVPYLRLDKLLGVLSRQLAVTSTEAGGCVVCAEEAVVSVHTYLRPR